MYLVKFFVHSSLRPGENLYSLIQQFVHRHESGWVKADFRAVGGQMVLVDAETMVPGDLLYVDVSGAMRVDVLQAVSNCTGGTSRRMVTVELDSGGSEAAWAHYWGGRA